MSGSPTLGALGALLLSTATASAGLPSKPMRPAIVPEHGKQVIDTTFVPAVLKGEKVNVMVELEDEPAIKTFAEARNLRHLSVVDARRESENRAADLDRTQRQVVRQIHQPNIKAKVLFRVQHAYNGIAISVSPENVEQIRAMPGVKAIVPLKPKKRMANSSVAFLNTFNFWDQATQMPAGLDLTGTGIKIGVIDTGIDYIHKTFGGSGSDADYATNESLTTTAPNQFFPNKVVAGGYDFAGDAYDADPQDPTYNPVPAPDPNPFDSYDPTSEGHGTATASIAAGRGVGADTNEYPGPYDFTVPLESMILGPGLAPSASIYAYRVFGDFGSTNLVTEGVDQALIDGVDVLSLSLGGDFGAADDPDTVALSNAADAGIICVAAAGNAGDTYFITGSPADGNSVISVAASYNNDFKQDFVVGNAPAAIAGLEFLFTAGTDGPALATDVTPMDVVYAVPHIGLPQNADGTFPDLTNAADIKGHVCLIDRGSLSFYIKVAEAQQAGATAVIIANNQAGAITPITSGPGPNGTTFVPTIPNGAISQADGITLETYLDPNGTDSGGEKVSFLIASAADGVPSYTSRGPSRPDGLLKPDVTAPAEAVDAAEHLSGYEAIAFNGTSSATPHVAGSMALMKEEHPTWTVEQLKALVMNTADMDLFIDPQTRTTKIGPGRVGNGRMDLAPASKANVIAYDADRHGAVSVSFGSVDVPIDSAFTPISHTVNVVNKGATAQTFNVAFESTGTDVPGVTFTVPSKVTVPATTTANGVTTDGATTLKVTLNADPAVMLHTHDPSIEIFQSGLVREFKSEATGYITLTPTTAGGTPIRLVVYALPRPVSTSHGSKNLTVGTIGNTVSIAFTGEGVDNESATDSETNVISLLKLMELQYIGPGLVDDGMDDAAAQLQYVGVSSDYVSEGEDLGNTVFNFGIVSYGDHAAPDYNTFEYDIDVDTSGSDTFNPGYVIFNDLAGTDGSYTNVYFPAVFDLNAGTLNSDYFTNGFSSTGVDTNIFNTNVLTYPVPAFFLGMTSTSSSVIHYQVNAYYEGLLISQSPVLTYDPVHPGLFELTPDLSVNAEGEFDDSGVEPSVDIDYGIGDFRTLAYSPSGLKANGSLGALALHFHNASGARADVVRMALPVITYFLPRSGPVGATVVIAGRNLDTVTSVEFGGVKATTFKAGTKGRLLRVVVPAGAQTGLITLISSAGEVPSKGNFTVTTK